MTADEVLAYLQDVVTRLLGPHALPVAEEHLRRCGTALAELARDRAALGALLSAVVGDRPGFQESPLGWSADRPQHDT